MRYGLIPLLLASLTACDDHLLGEAADEGTGTEPLYTSDWQGVQDFFDAECNVCHVAGGAGGFSLVDAIDADLADADDSNNVWVIPGDAAGSRLWESIAWTGTAIPMPAGAQAALPENEIGHVRDWIDAGAAQ